jgi:hypothetical protein
MCSLEVSDIVLSDYEAGALRTQFSLAFETTTDDDAADDQVAFELGSNDSQIVVEYLVR